MKIYGDKRSGNCYKLQLAASLLNLKYSWHDVDIMLGETRSETFLTLNPAGEIPLVVLDDGRHLSESNAIINYFAEGTALAPTDSYHRATIQQWQFWEQYNHEPRIAVARFIKLYQGLPESRRAEFEALQKPGNRALALMDARLQAFNWLAGDRLSMADVSLYAYTHVADEGGFDIKAYEGINAWIARMQAQPNYAPMTPS